MSIARHTLTCLLLALASVAFECNAQASAPGSAPEESRRAALLQTLGDLEKRIEVETHGRVRYLGPSTQEEPYRSYYKRFAANLEKLGTDHFPMRAGKSVYGRVSVNVSVSRTGSVKDIQVLKSDDPLLTSHSIALLRTRGLVEQFPAQMDEKLESLVLLASFNYVRE